MGFLKRFIRTMFRDQSAPAAANSFQQLNEQDLEAHLAVDHYGDFRLTDAIRPSYDLSVLPRQGYRHDSYRDEETREVVPVVMAAISRERLLETFLELLDPLGPVVDVVLETSHNPSQRGHRDLYREHIDLPVLKSCLWDFEDLLLNDGCTGIAVLNPSIPQEVQLDEHKLLILYGDQLEEFEGLFQRQGVACDPQIKFLIEAEHVHSSSEDFARQFEDLRVQLGMDGEYA